MINRYHVLLLHAPVPGPHNRVVAKSAAIPPLGLGYLASILIEHNFEVRIYDMDVEDIGVSQLQKILESFSPAVVGISTTTLTFKNGLRVAKVVKYTLPECLVCMGGPHVSINYQEAICYPFVDLVVRGEGEKTFLEICRAYSEGGDLPISIDGTVVRYEDQVLVLPKRLLIENLDSLPYPARHLMPLHLYNIPGTILTSRGCPTGCGFCAGPIVLGSRYRMRSADNVISEVQMCVDLFGITSFYFIDDTMTYDIQRLTQICEGLRQIDIPSRLGRKLKWTCESRADVVTPEILRDMRNSGCTSIQFGMESGSQELLDLLGKKVTLKQIEQAVYWSRQAGISPVLSMVFPHPNETEQTICDTINFIKKLYDIGAEKILPSLLTLFPGTRFMEQKEELGIKLLSENTEEYNVGTPILTTRYLDLKTIVNVYSQILMLTQILGGDQISGLEFNGRLNNASSR